MKWCHVGKGEMRAKTYKHDIVIKTSSTPYPMPYITPYPMPYSTPYPTLCINGYEVL